MNIRRILVVRSDRLGDTLLSTPLLAALSEAYPEAEITMLASPIGAQALEGNPRIHEVIAADLQGTGLIENLLLVRRLRLQRFDVTLCLSEKRRPRLVTWLAGSPVRVGFDPGRRQPLVSLLCRIGLTHRVIPAGELHEVERYAALLGPLGIEGGTGPLEIHLPDEDRAWATEWAAGHVPDGAVPVVVNLSGKWLRDGWTIGEFGGMCRSLLAALPNVALIVTTDHSDAHLLDGLMQLRASDRVCTVSGESLGRWAALIGRSRALITMDTGAVHVAAALGVPVADVFSGAGFEHCSRRWAPWRTAHRIVRRGPIGGTDAAVQADRFSIDMADALRALLSRIRAESADEPAP